MIKVWDRIWFTRFDAFSVGAFRILLGILISVWYVFISVKWTDYYGIFGRIWSYETELDFSPSLGWNLFHWTRHIFPVEIIWLVGMVSALAFTVGWHTRIFTVILFLLQISMINQNPMVLNGEDLTFRMMLFYGIFAPLGHELSLDRVIGDKKRRARQLPPLRDPMIWAVRGLQINFILIYVISLPAKITADAAWRTGDAIYLTMVSNMWSRGFLTELSYVANGFFSKMMTYTTILVEGTFPVLVWFRKTRLIIIFLLMGMHLTIPVILNGVTFFSIAMICGLILFIPGETMRKALKHNLFIDN